MIDLDDELLGNQEEECEPQLEVSNEDNKSIDKSYKGIDLSLLGFHMDGIIEKEQKDLGVYDMSRKKKEENSIIPNDQHNLPQAIGELNKPTLFSPSVIVQNTQEVNEDELRMVVKELQIEGETRKEEIEGLKKEVGGLKEQIVDLKSKMREREEYWEEILRKFEGLKNQ
ncbi:unnamed protein product [Moneuplotes crassus]|uniref:Uncharacterized protein n=1 Tax=Euplotes crassus TaxID=5936 RepID=A0AAD1XSW2_EUPCR|nr:unnamed protein product [Moneuplotes crassus]